MVYKKLVRHPRCIYCKAKLNPERVAATGYQHCTKRECVNNWRLDRIQSEDLQLRLVPKSGMTWVRGDSMEAQNSGKSSGK